MDDGRGSAPLAGGAWMTDWILSIQGTPEGQHWAFVLAIAAAFLHAVFGALQKGQRADPWLSRTLIDISNLLISLPFVIFVVPFPEPRLWPILFGAMLIHLLYKILQAMAYQRGAFTVVYPVTRGTAPLFAVIGAGILFHETFQPLQWAGIAVLLSGIFGLAAYNLATIRVDRDTLVPALGWAVATGAFVALYTTYDAWGIRQAADPFTFLAWFFFLEGIAFPLMNLRRLSALKAPGAGALIRLGVTGAVVAYFSFGSIMLATRIGQVGQAAVLRETSTVFAALIGWLMLGERVGSRRLALMALISIGAIIVQFGALH